MENSEYAKGIIIDAFKSSDVEQLRKKFERMRSPENWENFVKKLEEVLKLRYKEDHPGQDVREVQLSVNTDKTVYMQDFEISHNYILKRHQLFIYIGSGEKQIEISFPESSSKLTTVKKPNMSTDELGKILEVLS